MTESKKSYYAVIPANVRYDESLPPNAKLLYGEITALCNAEGYCWASNKYFADLYGVSIASIKRWIKSLIDNGYITSRLIYKEGSNEIDMRYIQICTEGGIKNEPTPSIKNEPDNNTSLNTTFNNTNEYIDKSDKPTRKRFIPPSLEEVQAYCRERNNNVDAERFINHYTSNGWMVGKNKMQDWKAAVRTWERNGYDTKKPAEQPKSSGNIFLDLLKEGAFDE
jgi:hypothetical protein